MIDLKASCCVNKRYIKKQENKKMKKMICVLLAAVMVLETRTAKLRIKSRRLPPIWIRRETASP